MITAAEWAAKSGTTITNWAVRTTWNDGEVHYEPAESREAADARVDHWKTDEVGNHATFAVVSRQVITTDWQVTS